MKATCVVCPPAGSGSYMFVLSTSKMDYISLCTGALRTIVSDFSDVTGHSISSSQFDSVRIETKV
jgi:hypothetical protein